MISDDPVYAVTDEMVDVAVLDNDDDPHENLVVGSVRITRAPTAGTTVVAPRSVAEAIYEGEKLGRAL